MTPRCPTCGARSATWTRPNILAAMAAWTDEHGTPPKIDAWKAASPDHPTSMTVIHMFGTWNAGLLEAGLPLRRRLWSRDDTLRAIFEWRYEHGRLPKRAEWKFASPDLTRPTANVVARLFGSWSEGIRQAGYPPPRPSAAGDHARRRSEAGTYA